MEEKASQRVRKWMTAVSRQHVLSTVPEGKDTGKYPFKGPGPSFISFTRSQEEKEAVLLSTAGSFVILTFAPLKSCSRQERLSLVWNIV